MKTKINHILLSFVFVFMFFSSCQDEISQIDDLNDQETIIPNSALANLMSRASANFGAADDILDGASCFSVELPVTIEVSDVTITIETEADLEQLENLLDNATLDDDILDFIFPITIIFSDYSQIVIENEDQLQNIIDACIDEENGPIECADFVYPISFSVFNAEFILVDTVIIHNDEALYAFLDGLEDDENALIVSINFPISIAYANGETVEVTTNEELANAIEAAEQYCDDGSSYCSQEDLTANLVECPWEVFLYTNNDTDSLDGPYQFNFNENGVLTIEGITSETHTTSWDLIETDAGLELNIAAFYYYEAQFGNWLVVECDTYGLRLEHLTVDGTGLIFERDCEGDLECSLTDISSILQECPWAFSDGTGNFINDRMIFNPNAELQISEGMATSAIGGAWNLSVTDNGVVLNFSELTAFQDTLGGDWLIVDCDVDRLELTKGNQTLVLEQACDEALFSCFGDFEIETCEQPNNIPVYNLSAETIGLIDCPEPFEASFHETLAEAEDNLNPIANTEEFATLEAQVYLRIEAASGNFQLFTVYLNVVECNYFECFENRVIEKCDENNPNDGYTHFALHEIYANCSQDDVETSFHVTIADAQAATNALTSPYTNTSNPQTIYARIQLATNPNYFEVFEVELIVEDCSANPFECFEGFDAIMEVCDNGTDGPYLFNLTQAYANCTPSADTVSYHETIADAENSVNPISNPEVYASVDVEQTIFVRVQINDQIEIFAIQLLIVNCNDICTEQDVDNLLLECVWNITSYNGSDNLIVYNLDFEVSNQTVVIYNDEFTIDAHWSTSQTNDGVIIALSNVAGPNIQAINGNWLVVECTENQLVLHNVNDSSNEMVLDRTCQ